MPEGPTLPGLAIRLRRTKTSSAEAGERALAVGRPVQAFARLARIFENRERSGVSAHRQMGWDRRAALDPQSVNAVIKSRYAAAGLDRGQYSAHGLRSVSRCT
jgi:UDP-3-O-[3-hydroxymyristoyl] glucosamine N-acyltransferase